MGIVYTPVDFIPNFSALLIRIQYFVVLVSLFFQLLLALHALEDQIGDSKGHVFNISIQISLLLLQLFVQICK